MLLPHRRQIAPVLVSAWQTRFSHGYWSHMLKALFAPFSFLCFPNTDRLYASHHCTEMPINLWELHQSMRCLGKCYQCDDMYQSDVSTQMITQAPICNFQHSLSFLLYFCVGCFLVGYSRRGGDLHCYYLPVQLFCRNLLPTVYGPSYISLIE
jgi:hypothetical protein